MNITEVIKYPILTEKSSQKIDQGIYTFAVDKRTNKAEVKRVVEFIFDVKVAQVNIMTIRKKPKKLGKFAGFKSGYKKAIVTLSKGSIQLFKDEAPKEEIVADDKEFLKPTTIKRDEISDIEKRAAAKIAAKAQEKLSQTSDSDEISDSKKDEKGEEK